MFHLDFSICQQNLKLFEFFSTVYLLRVFSLHLLNSAPESSVLLQQLIIVWLCNFAADWARCESGDVFLKLWLLCSVEEGD